MTIALKANAAGTQGEIQLNGNPVAEFLANAVNFPGLAQSLTPNGYVKLPGGLIIQWGESSAAVAARSIAFPIPFPNAVLSVQATPKQATTPITGTMVCASTSGHTVNGFTGATWTNSTGIPAFSAAPFTWLAVGY